MAHKYERNYEPNDWSLENIAKGNGSHWNFVDRVVAWDARYQDILWSEPTEYDIVAAHT